MPQIMRQIWGEKCPRSCCRLKGKGGEGRRRRETREKEGVRSAPDHVAGSKEREGRGEEKREK